MTKLGMVYKQLFVFKKVWLIAVAVLVAGACASPEALQEAVEESQQNNGEIIPPDNSELMEEERASAGTANPVVITYQNASSNIQISLDPSRDQFYLDLKGMTPSEKDSIIVVDSTIIEQRAVDIQSLLSGYRKAQDLFYLGEYRDALEEVDKTLEIQETADAFALKGTIFFMLDNITAARANWNRAVQLDPDIPVPSIPELETLINEIREDGDQ